MLDMDDVGREVSSVQMEEWMGGTFSSLMTLLLSSLSLVDELLTICRQRT